MISAAACQLTAGRCGDRLARWLWAALAFLCQLAGCQPPRSTRADGCAWAPGFDGLGILDHLASRAAAGQDDELSQAIAATEARLWKQAGRLQQPRHDVLSAALGVAVEHRDNVVTRWRWAVLMTLRRRGSGRAVPHGLRLRPRTQVCRIAARWALDAEIIQQLGRIRHLRRETAVALAEARAALSASLASRAAWIISQLAAHLIRLVTWAARAAGAVAAVLLRRLAAAPELPRLRLFTAGRWLDEVHCPDRPEAMIRACPPRAPCLAGGRTGKAAPMTG